MPTPEFILGLRSHVGHAPLWLSGVSVVVQRADSRILLARRTDLGVWAAPSGIIEPGEEPAGAALRELREETGIDAELIRLTSVDVSPVITYPNGDVTQYLELTFLGRFTAGEAKVADEENTDVGWFDPNALPTDVSPTTSGRIAKALSGSPECWFRR